MTPHGESLVGQMGRMRRFSDDIAARVLVMRRRLGNYEAMAFLFPKASGV